MTPTVQRLQRWLHSGANIEAFDKKNNSRLHRAVIDNDPESVALLLDYGANPLLGNFEDLTPSHFAKYLNRPVCRDLMKIRGKRDFLFKSSDGEIKHLDRSELESRFSFTYIDHLEFPFAETIEYTTYLTANFIDRHSKEKALRWGRRFEKQIENSELANVYVQHINATIGYGLFALDPIEKGSYIGEYVGKIVEPRLGTDPSYQMKYILDTINQQALIVDAIDKGNLLRFANHSEHGNLRPIHTHVHDIIHIIFIANRNIAADEQLCYNYGQGYWSLDQDKTEI